MQSTYQTPREQGIGTWSATAKYTTGTVIHFNEFINSSGTASAPVTYMYVQFDRGALTTGPGLGYQGNPVGLYDDVSTTSVVVSSDFSTCLGNSMMGILVNSSTTAVTDAYYGWIQLARPGEILRSAMGLDGLDSGDLLLWSGDGGLISVAAHNSLLDNVPNCVLGGDALEALSADSLSLYSLFDVFVMGADGAT